MLVHSNADAMGWFREVNAIDKWMRWLLCALAHTHTHMHMKMKTSTHTHANANAHTLLCTSTAQTSASTIPLHGAAMEHSALASWNHRTHIVTTFSNYIVCFLHISFFATRWYICEPERTSDWILAAKKQPEYFECDVLCIFCEVVPIIVFSFNKAKRYICLSENFHRKLNWMV